MTTGNQTGANVADDYAALKFLVEQQIAQVSTATLARVIDCTNDGGVAPVGTLTVQLLVNMLAGDNTAFKHAPIYKVPYARIQGGVNAVILDPSPGDIGLVGFCERDISAVKASRDISNPGSRRVFSKADGVWLATVWASHSPQQYVVFAQGGIEIISPNAVTIRAPVITLDGLVETTGDVHVAGTLTGDVDVIAAGKSGAHHTHTSAAPGQQTSPPT